jgi:rfaE bifunctional protein nucleotidyltransferase chain/domain
LEKEIRKVFVNGTFDILHIGHYRLLNYAKSYGTHLIVATDTDERIKKLKGPSRPINSLIERIEALRNLKAVDTVLSFSTDEELESTIKQVSPDIMIVGGDWKDKTVIGSQFAKKLIYFERIDGYSTTEKIQRIIDRR